MDLVNRWKRANLNSRARTARRLTAGGAALLAAGLAACGTGGTSARLPSDGRADQLNVQFSGPPISLNPALNGNGGSSIFTSLDYDPLIYLSGSGELVPDLATSWRYVGNGNKVFELTLRRGVRFTDGSLMTARAVANSMNYFLRAGGSLIGGVGQIASVTARGDDTVRVVYKTSNPDAAMSMDQYSGIGSIIGPTGLAAPKSLLTSSDGTGQYTFDNGGSVTNSSYSYVRNPHYFNPPAQRFNQVSVKVITDPSAVIAAAETGEVQYAAGSASTAAAAAASGLAVLKEPFFNWSLILPPSGGAVKAIANRDVRQAIAYALDRPALARALGGTFSAASGQVLLPGTDGYVPGRGYDYDLRKARQLMARAGYPHGFSMPILTESLLDPDTTISQAVAQALSGIGIRASLSVVSTGIGQFAAAAMSKQYAAVLFPSAGTDMFQLAQQILAPGIFNPFALSTPPPVQELLDRAYASAGETRTRLYQQVNEMLTDTAAVVPIMSSDPPNYVSGDLGNVVESVTNPNPVPEAPVASLAWFEK